MSIFSGIVDDGVFYISLTESPIITWQEAFDKDSGVDHYEICLGSSLGSCDIHDWFSIGSVLSYQFQGNSFIPDQIYFTSVKVKDRAGNEAILNSDGWVAVGLPSSITSIDDDIAYTSLVDTPTITWNYPGALASSIVGFKYQISIGSLQGATDIVGWTDVGTATSWSTTGLSLILGNQYFASVRIVDNSSTIYSTIQGDGWYVVNSSLVNARFPLATNWNSYVLRSDPSQNCNYQGYFICVHGGESKKVDLVSAASCTGYSIQDELGAFDWVCDDTGGVGNVYFYSRGLRKTKGLADLVNSSSWKNNRIVIYNSGTPIAPSDRTAWWTNTVTPLVNSSVNSVMTQNTIYTLNSNMTVTSGYNMYQGSAIVTLGSNILKLSNNLEILFKEHPVTNGYLWIEGNFQGTSKTGYFAYFWQGSSVIRRTNVSYFRYGIGYTSLGGSRNLYYQLNSSNNFGGAYLKFGEVI